MSLTKVSYAMIQYESANVFDYGAVGDGVADDTAAIQAAFNTGKNVYFPSGYTFGITSELTLNTNNVTLFGGGTISFLASYNTAGNTLLSAITINGSNVVLDGLNFNGAAISVASVDNRFVWFKASKGKVIKCSFVSLINGGSNFNGAIQANAAASFLTVTSSYFEDCPGAVFCQGPNCVMSNNTVLNPKDVCFVLNSTNSKYGVITGNTINNTVPNSAGALIAPEEGASYWSITNNVINGVKDGIAIGALNVNLFPNVVGGVISGNVVNGGAGTTTSAATLIFVSEYYFDTVVTNNVLSNLPTGFSGSAYINVSANGSIVANNIVDAEAYTGAVLMLIRPGAKGLSIENNTFNTVSAARHVLFNAGDYAGLPVTFTGGKFYGGGEGINTALNSPTNLTIYMVNVTEVTATAVVNMSAGMAWGLRQSYFNTYGAIKFPHSIKQNTVMYGNAVPTTGAWLVGDKITNLTPVVGQPKAWACTVSGTPGTWVSEGNL